MAKNEFTATVNGKVFTLKTVHISSEIRFESNKYHADAWNKGLLSGVPLKIEMERLLEQRGVLDTKAEEAKSFDLRKKLKDLEILLRKGIAAAGGRMTKSEGRAIAIQMRGIRSELGAIGSTLSSYFSNTVESQADSERLQFFIYACTVHFDTGERYWKSYDAFRVEDNAELVDAATKGFLSTVAGIDKDYEMEFYENKWLKKQGFLNDKGQLLDSKGRLVDSENRLIDADGRFINEDGHFVDIYGNAIDKDGAILIEDSWADKTSQDTIST